MIWKMSALITVALLSGPHEARSQEVAEPLVEFAVPLGHAYGAEMIAIRLDALAAFGSPPEGLIEVVARVLTRDLPRFSGTLQRIDAELAGSLELDLQRVIDRAGQREVGGLSTAINQTRELVFDARDRLVPAELREDPAFQAALVSMLLLANDGVAEAYEDAASGAQWEYPHGWAALRRVRTLLTEIGPAMAEENDGEISEVMSLLGQLFPSPGPPDAFRGDPEEAEAPAHRIVGSLESGLGVSLFPDRDRVTLLTLVEDLIGSACEAYADGSVRVGRERIMLAHFFYDEYQREMLRLFDPELAARTADDFSPFLSDREEEAPGHTRCESLGDTFAEVRTVLGS